MKETTKQRWGRFGYLCLSFVPMLGYLVLMGLVSGVVTVMLLFGKMMTEGFEMEQLMDLIAEWSMPISLIYALLGLLLFGIWYYFGCRRKSFRIPGGIFSWKKIIAILLVAFGGQFAAGYLVTIIAVIAPGLVEQYAQMIELAGITELTVVGFLYAVILGPIAEELIFRGVTLFYAKRVTKRFWVANMIQALAFGIVHMNVVQGLYAFVVGLIFGWIYEKFHSLYACMLAHIVFNFLGSCVLDKISGMLENYMGLFVIWEIAGGVVFVIGMMLLREKKKEIVEEV